MLQLCERYSLAKTDAILLLLIDVTVSLVGQKYYSKIPLIWHFRKVVPENRSSAFYKTKAPSMKQEDFRDMFTQM